MKHVAAILGFALLAGPVHVQAQEPIHVTVSFKGTWSTADADHWDDCKGKAPLTIQFDGDIAPSYTADWNAQKRTWEGTGQASFSAPTRVDCTFDYAANAALQGVKPTMSTAFIPAPIKATAHVSIDLSEADPDNQFFFTLEIEPGTCKAFWWRYDDITGRGEKLPMDADARIVLEVQPGTGELESDPKFTANDLRAGFTQKIKIPQSSVRFCGSVYGSNVDEGLGEWTALLSYAPNASKAKVALTGCTDVVVGQAANLRASGTPAGGKFNFKAQDPSVVEVMPLGSSATINGASPGVTHVDVDYTAPTGDKATASEVVHCVKVESINEGKPVKVGMYDEKGNRLEAKHDVPVSVLPREAARRVIFKPGDAAALTAASDAGTILTLTALKPAKTQVQPLTSCGAVAGPALAVDIVPCTDDVIEKVRTEEKNIRTRIGNVIKEMSQITGDDEFERAAREGPAHIKELAQKTIELLGKLALKSKGSMSQRMRNLIDDPYVSSKYVAAKGIDQISDAATLGEMYESVFNDNEAAAELKAGEMARDKIADLITHDAWGIAKTAYEAAQASAALGQDLGTMKGAADRLAELESQLDQLIKERDRVWHVLYDLCQAKRAKEDDSSASKPKTPPSKTAPAKKPPLTASGKPLDVKDVPAEKPAPTTKTETKTPPPANKAAPVATGLYTEAAEKQCNGWTPVLHKESNVFGTMAQGLGQLKSNVDEYTTSTLNPLVEQVKTTQAIFNGLLAAGKLPKGERAAALADLRKAAAANPSSKFVAFAESIEKTQAGLDPCAPVLQNSFEVKIEDIKTKY